jgi:hypothetical protein
MKKILSALLVLVLSLSLSSALAVNTSSQALTPQTSYEYPILPGTDEWAKFETHIEMVSAVQVPTDVLKKMTTEELAATVLDNPLLPLIYAYYTFEVGYDKGYIILCRDLNCLQELDSRANASEYLSKVIEERRTSIKTSLEDYSNPVVFKCAVGEIILNCMLSSTSSLLSQANQKSDINVGYSTTTVYTPNNSPVSVYSGLTWADHGTTAVGAQATTDYYMSLYPNAVKIANQSPVYNCHNYAWDTGATTSYWMDSPSAYMSDGSYSNTGSALAGYRVDYPSDDHSSIIISNYDDNIYVKSKWGYLPVFEHNVYYCPYASTGITFWKR